MQLQEFEHDSYVSDDVQDTPSYTLLLTLPPVFLSANSRLAKTLGPPYNIIARRLVAGQAQRRSFVVGMTEVLSHRWGARPPLWRVQVIPCGRSCTRNVICALVGPLDRIHKYPADEQNRGTQRSERSTTWPKEESS